MPERHNPHHLLPSGMLRTKYWKTGKYLQADREASLPYYRNYVVRLIYELTTFLRIYMVRCTGFTAYLIIV